MENINYTKFSEENKIETPAEAEAATTTTTAGPAVEITALPPEASAATIGYVEIIDEPEEPEIEEKKEVTGVVANCGRLNVRKEADLNAEVLKIINVGTTVKIDEENSTEDFYKVQVAGYTGFCAKEFIAVE